MRKRPASGLGFIEPMLPTLVDDPPEGGEWIHEVKFDGHRSQLVKEFDRVRIFTRNGFDWTAKYAPLVEAADGLAVASAIIDGEIIVPDPDTGLTHFQALRSAIRKTPDRLIFVAFDILHLNGHDLRDMSLEERRHLLEDVIGDSDTGGRFQFSEPLEGTAKAIPQDRSRQAGRDGFQAA